MVFVQAEDGIRGLVRSRGLGDVYKRQVSFGAMTLPHQLVRVLAAEQLYRAATILSGHPYPVSYTHLTLPTSDLV